MNVLKSVLAYFKYYLDSKTIYKVHSPFLFGFIEDCITDNREYYCFSKIEKIRYEYKSNHSLISIQDFGAGSRVNKEKQVSISNILKSATSNARKCKILYKLAQHVEAEIQVELGTNLGISAAYLAFARPQSLLYTLEGDPTIRDLANQQFTVLGLENVNSILGDFGQTLGPFLSSLSKKIDLVYLDGNHRKEATIEYFEMIKPHLSLGAAIVVDDIRWSSQMLEAWKNLQSRSEVAFSFDYGQFGILFLQKNELKDKATHLTFIDYKFKPWQIGLFS